MIVLAVQQGITSLPPTSGQSFLYEYDAASDLFVKRPQLGPTAFRSAETIGKGQFSFRFATSYFALGDTFGPITYNFDFAAPPPPSLGYPQSGVTQFGVGVSAKVVLFNLALNYGFTDRIEGFINLPLVLTDVSGSQLYPASIGDASQPPLVSGAANRQQLNTLLNCNAAQCLRIANVPYTASGVNFSEGTNFGVGRISLGAKYRLYMSDLVRLTFSPEFFAPSPNQAEYAGSDSPAFLWRLISSVKITDPMRFHADVAYDYDFDFAELSRFVWNTGLSYSFGPSFIVDTGVGGSKFNRGIQWTPDTAQFAPTTVTIRQNDGSVVTETLPGGTITKLAGSGNTLGDTFVDFLLGLKYKLTDNLVLSGTVNVPLNDEGLRAVAVGTVAIEAYY